MDLCSCDSRIVGAWLSCVYGAHFLPLYSAVTFDGIFLQKSHTDITWVGRRLLEWMESPSRGLVPTPKRGGHLR